jgi:hypothetical protein
MVPIKGKTCGVRSGVLHDITSRTSQRGKITNIHNVQSDGIQCPIVMCSGETVGLGHGQCQESNKHTADLK